MLWLWVSFGNVHRAGSNSNLFVVMILNRGDDLDSAGLVRGYAGLCGPGNQSMRFSSPVL